MLEQCNLIRSFKSSTETNCECTLSLRYKKRSKEFRSGDRVGHDVVLCVPNHLLK